MVRHDKLYVMCNFTMFLKFFNFHRWTEKMFRGKRGIWYLYSLSYVLFLNINASHMLFTYVHILKHTDWRMYITVQIMYHLYNVTCTNTHYLYRLHTLLPEFHFVQMGSKFHIHFYLFYLQLNPFKSSEIVLVHYLLMSTCNFTVWIYHDIFSQFLFPMGKSMYFGPSVLKRITYTFFCLFLMAVVSSVNRRVQSWKT